MIHTPTVRVTCDVAGKNCNGDIVIGMLEEGRMWGISHLDEELRLAGWTTDGVSGWTTDGDKHTCGMCAVQQRRKAGAK